VLWQQHFPQLRLCVWLLVYRLPVFVLRLLVAPFQAQFRFFGLELRLALRGCN
jgi:hypothetical protein